jgi:hypothetical protein
MSVAETTEAVATNIVGKGSCCWSEGVAVEDEEGEEVESGIVDPLGVGDVSAHAKEVVIC